MAWRGFTFWSGWARRCWRTCSTCSRRRAGSPPESTALAAASACRTSCSLASTHRPPSQCPTPVKEQQMKGPCKASQTRSIPRRVNLTSLFLVSRVVPRGFVFQRNAYRLFQDVSRTWLGFIHCSWGTFLPRWTVQNLTIWNSDLCCDTARGQLCRTTKEDGCELTCCKNMCSSGCDLGLFVTSNSGRKMLLRISWKLLTFPVILYTSL